MTTDATPAVDPPAEVRLTAACRLTGRTYYWLYHKLLAGTIKGRHDGKHWWIEMEEVRRLQAEAAAETEAAAKQAEESTS